LNKEGARNKATKKKPRCRVPDENPHYSFQALLTSKPVQYLALNEGSKIQVCVVLMTLDAIGHSRTYLRM